MNATAYSTIGKKSSGPVYSSLPVGGRGGVSWAAIVSGSPGATVRPVTSAGTPGLRQNPARNAYQSAATRAVTTTGNAEELLSQGFDLLRKKQWDSAVKVFKTIKPETQNQNERKVNGLARALYHQPGKAGEALDVLNQLSASVQTDTLITKSRILQALERYQEAEDLLKQIVKKEAGDPEKGRPCRYRDRNIALARLWQMMGKFDKAERLLIATLRQESLQPSDLEAGRACKNHDTKLGLARLWQMMGKFDKAERLLIATFRQESVQPGDLEAGRACKHHETNLTLARYWQMMGKLDIAERLLIAMFRQESARAGDLEADRACNNHETNHALARHWQVMGKLDRAERLLIATFRQESAKADDLEAGGACKNQDTNLTLARHWQMMGKLDQAERLLIATFRQESVNADDLEKGKACKHHKTNLGLARLWQMMGKLDQAERLLIATFRQESGTAGDLEAGRACKNHETNLGLARLWQIMGKLDKAECLLITTFREESTEAGEPEAGRTCNNHETNLTLACHWAIMGKVDKAQSLLQRCLSENTLVDVQKDHFRLALSILHCGTHEFGTYIDAITNKVDKALAQSIHRFKIYCQRVSENGLQEPALLDQAFNYVEEAMQLLSCSEKRAQLLSQKAHIMRMQKKAESEWRSLFQQASCLDPARVLKEKIEPWRRSEQQALKKLNIQSSD
ncbi:hypothetical protein [Endozoicomonas sp. SCSIO W0465]|uniref:tetratricopeptide repeat protein n=1 Tax=Endozoicomonas sp. SCSIO W0465 TaxID=2918516 RepID=UPI00207547E4|nr:hypothetical protein [Endozoicomonas sp. SCSIO W0465]USE37816.1 hypothetical protein MJO57_06385 [Endozoicomonas sp. SCSIO W0465]